MPAAKTFSDRVVERYDSAPLIEVVVDIIAASQAIPLLNARGDLQLVDGLDYGAAHEADPLFVIDFCFALAPTPFFPGTSTLRVR